MTKLAKMTTDGWIATCISGSSEIPGESYQVNTLKNTGGQWEWMT